MPDEINVNSHRLNRKNLMIISVSAERIFDKIQYYSQFFQKPLAN